MSRILSRIVLLICLSAVSTGALAQQFVKFGTYHDEDFWGTTGAEFSPSFPSTLDYLSQNGRHQITSLDLNDSNVTDVFAGNYGAFQAVVVSESFGSLDVTSNSAFRSYVDGGGCLIVTSDHGNGPERDFLNSIFGYNTTVTGTDDDSDTFDIQAAAIGTAFEGGPATLIAEDATGAYGNTPGTTVYSGSVGVGLFFDEFGDGTIVATGFDYCCSGSSSEQSILDWYEIADRAFSQCELELLPDPPTPVPASSNYSRTIAVILLGLVGLIFIRRKTVRMRI